MFCVGEKLVQKWPATEDAQQTLTWTNKRRFPLLVLLCTRGVSSFKQVGVGFKKHDHDKLTRVSDQPSDFVTTIYYLLLFHSSPDS